MNPSISPELAHNVLGYVQVSSLFAKKAIDQVIEARLKEKRAADLQPALVERMVALKTIEPTQKVAAAKLLADHAETLGLLKYAHEEIARLRLQLAQAVPTPEPGTAIKEASVAADGYNPGAGDYNSLTDPRVGRRTSEKKASDVALSRGLKL